NSRNVLSRAKDSAFSIICEASDPVIATQTRGRRRYSKREEKLLEADVIIESGFGAILQAANCRCNNDLRILFPANFLSAPDDTSVTLTTSYPVVTVHVEDFYFVWVSGNRTSPRPGFREIR